MTKWLQVFPARSRSPSRARVRVICFPHAGGPAATFFPWAAQLADDIELSAVELPARRARLAEPAVTSLDAIVDALERELAPRLEPPFVLFGHSMGAIVAFELIRRLRALGRRLPSRLIVSGARAPHLAREPEIHALPDPQFIAGVVALGGMSEEVTREPGLMELLLPALRADFTAIERWRYRDAAPLDLPISAFGGTHDPRVARDQLAAWGTQTRSAFTVQQFPGDHFYLVPHRDALLRAIAPLLAR